MRQKLTTNFEIAFDLDGTLWSNAFPKIGEPNHEMITVLKYLYRNGFGIVIWTCREDVNGQTYLTDAIQKLNDLGVEYDAINNNTKQTQMLFNNNSRKLSVDMFVDDRSVGGLPSPSTVISDAFIRYSLKAEKE